MKVNKYDLVIFDVDGTMLDTSQGVISAVKHTIQSLNYEMLSDEILSTFIGPPIQDSFAKAYDLKGDILQEIATLFRDYYKNVDLLKAIPYKGMYEVFETIKNNRMQSAIATYKREDYAITLLNHFGFDKYTTVMHGADHENKLKKRDIIEICIHECGVLDKNRVVMVGDTKHDAIGAEEVGIDFIGVTFGFGFKSKEEIDKVKNVGCANNAIEILKFL